MCRYYEQLVGPYDPIKELIFILKFHLASWAIILLAVALTSILT
jgi:hypothetical protein